jgi:23S rRNA pseudouridine1911/1915/1917 synthase
MLLARNGEAASELARQIRDREFDKEYLAVVHGCPAEPQATLRDLLLRDKRECKTYVVQQMAKGVQEAILSYRLVNTVDNLSRLAIQLHTGRTHQIRCQFSSRGLPLVGDRKYSTNAQDCDIALWSYRLAFCHPRTGRRMEFCQEPPAQYPWNVV